MPNKIGAIKLPVERVHIEVTSHCNFSCEFCPDSRMKRVRGFMEFGLLRRILDEVAGEGLAKLLLFHIMGEPLLYPRIIEAVAYADELGLKTCITTNGWLLNKEMLDGLTRAGLSRIIVSLQTPDEGSFKFRGTRGFTFDEYRERVMSTARNIMDRGGTELTISFLSSPLRRLIFPVMPEISVADTSKDLQGHLKAWAEDLLKGSAHEAELQRVLRKVKRARSFKNNSIALTPQVKFETRIMGDWAAHSIKSRVKARVGFCPGIQENFGILWDGSLVYCCIDYEGKTTYGNIKGTSIVEGLSNDAVQQAVRGFNSFKVIHPHCRSCLGDKNHLNSIVRQVGSILYFKGYRRFFDKGQSTT